MNSPDLAITTAELKIVSAILDRHVPEYEVWAFGSRVQGKVKRFSDLDLAVLSKQPLSFGTLAALAEDFSESDLPYKVDIVDWATTEPAFRRRVESQHIVIQQPRPIAHGHVP